MGEKMIDPFSFIGNLYKLPVLLYVLAICLLFSYECFGWVGPITIIGGSILLVYRSYKKSQDMII